MEFLGKTVESAIESGLKELNISKEDAIITVVEKGEKGVLGFGGKKAKVIIEDKKEGGKRAVNFLDGLFEKLNVSAQAELSQDDDKIVINVLTTSSASLIGHRGEMLDALQSLASAVANFGNDKYKRVVVDCEGYRIKREETLINLAKKIADKAIKYGKSLTLEPMNPFERRIIHSALAEKEGVKTESQGNEPNRHVVIIPDNIKTYNNKNYKNKREKNDGFKSDMIKINKKTSGFGTFLGNSFKND